MIGKTALATFALLAAALLPGCAAPPPPGDSAPAATGIAMDRNSWGRPVARWTIDAMGKGSYTVPEPDVFNADRLVTRGFSVGPAGFAELRALLAPAEAQAGRDLPCGERITDQYYGTVRWGAAALRYDAGCRNPAAVRLVAALEQAERRVADWAAHGPILETVKVERQ
jgi:hypothetical protein